MGPWPKSHVSTTYTLQVGVFQHQLHIWVPLASCQKPRCLVCGLTSLGCGSALKILQGFGCDAKVEHCCSR